MRPDDGDSKAAKHPRRQPISYSSPWESDMSPKLGQCFNTFSGKYIHVSVKFKCIFVLYQRWVWLLQHTPAQSPRGNCIPQLLFARNMRSQEIARRTLVCRKTESKFYIEWKFVSVCLPSNKNKMKHVSRMSWVMTGHCAEHLKKNVRLVYLQECALQQRK